MTDKDLDKLSKFLHLTKRDVKDKYLESLNIYNKTFFRPKLERDGKPFGKCVFFEKGTGCKIHTAKPLHCRIAMSCKAYGEQLNTWFYLNHIVDATDPEAIRQWSVYLETHPTIPGGTMEDLVPDAKKRDEILSYKLLK
jgi:Fe-S-cluster containining protein